MARPLWQLIIYIVIAVAIGVGTLKLLGQASTPPVAQAYLGQLFAPCDADVWSFAPTPASRQFLSSLLPSGVGNTLCHLVQVFQAVTTPRLTNVGLNWFFLPFASLHFMLMLTYSVQSSSPFWAPLWPALVGLLGQLAGLSIFFPAMWLVVHFISTRNAVPGAPFYASSSRFLAGSFFTYLLMLNIFGMIWLPKGDLLTYFIIFFQIAPVLPGFFVAFWPKGSAVISQDLIQLIFFFFGGIAAAGHLIGLLGFFQQPQALPALFSLFDPSLDSGPAFADLLLWIDFLSMVASTALYIAWTAGFTWLIIFLVLSPILSPGLIFAYVMANAIRPIPSVQLKPKTE